jgi:small-conductance mechanosensitive channel
VSAPREEKPAERSAADGKEESAPGEALPADAPTEGQSVQQLKAELQGVITQIQAARKAAPRERASELGIDEKEFGKRLTLLEDLENVIRRRMTLLKRLADARKTMAGVDKQIEEFQPVKLETEPPFEVALLDSLRDELATVRIEAESDALSLETEAASVEQAAESLEEAERSRRQLRDQLEQAEEDAARGPLSWQLALAQLTERIAGHELSRAKAQHNIAQIETRSNERRIELLEAKIAYVNQNVRFTRQELTKHRAELDARRDELERQLRELRRADQANQARLEEAREALRGARGEEEIRRRTEALAAREALAQASSRGVELRQERVNNLAKREALWEQRFALTQSPSEADLAQWQRAARSTLEEIGRRREDVERRLQTLRTTKLDIENRLSSWDPSLGDKSEVELRLSALGNHEQHETDYLASLLRLERLAQRVADEVQAERRLDSWRKYRARFFYLAKDLWQRELLVIDDRSLRLGQLLRAALVFCSVMLIAWVGRIVIRRTLLRHLRARAETSETLVDDSLLAVARRTKRVFVTLMAIYLALMTLPLSDTSRGILNSIAIIVVTAQVAIWANATIKGFIDKTKKRRMEEDPSAASAFGLMGFFSQVAIWSAALLLILTNLGYEIGPLLAGLGVGGVAVAFALQSILGDIFCSIAIVLDKPFVLGDFIIVNDFLGTVENIGIKTTRLRSLSGEQIIFSNADLIGSRVRNFKRMYERRVVFTFGVIYETPLDKLQQIPLTVRSIIDGIDQTRFDRGHFKEYGDFSLNFEVVYYVLAPDYSLYMDIQQHINLRLFAAFQQAGIAFAYPTREIIVRSGGAPKLTEQPHAESLPRG